MAIACSIFYVLFVFTVGFVVILCEFIVILFGFTPVICERAFEINIYLAKQYHMSLDHL